MDEEQYQEKKDEFQNRIVELAGEMARPSERNRFIALDNAAEVLTEAARKGTTAGIQRVLNGYKDYYNIREDTAKKLEGIRNWKVVASSEGRKEDAISPTGFTGLPQPSLVIVSSARSVTRWKW